MRSTLRGLAMATMGLALAGSADASTLWVRDNPAGGVTSLGTPGGVFLEGTQSRPDGTLTGGSFMDIPTGVFDLQISPDNLDPWTEFLTYCLEPDQDLFLPDEYAEGGLGGYGNLSAQDIIWLEQLWAAQFDNTLTNSTLAAAFQFIIWELVADTTVDLSSGLVQLAMGEGAYGVATTWLNILAAGNWTARTPLFALVSPDSQDLIGRGDPVPEPASLLLLGTGLAGLASRARRRRRRA